MDVGPVSHASGTSLACLGSLNLVALHKRLRGWRLQCSQRTSLLSPKRIEYYAFAEAFALASTVSKSVNELRLSSSPPDRNSQSLDFSLAAIVLGYLIDFPLLPGPVVLVQPVFC